MVFEFIFSYSQLNLAFFISKKKEIIWKNKLLKKKIVKIFEYKKNNNNYWDKTKLHLQIVNKTLLIAEIFYPRYSLFFIQ